MTAIYIHMPFKRYKTEPRVCIDCLVHTFHIIPSQYEAELTFMFNGSICSDGYDLVRRRTDYK